MKVLVVGNGAREHALCWALRRSRRLSDLYCAPGNAGTAELATNVPIAADAIEVLAAWATDEGIGLTMVGPESPLAAGLVDAVAARGLRAFGPTRAAAAIEASKGWARAFMERHRIPGPRARVCEDLTEGLKALSDLGPAVAIKADGLAAGKGVVLARSEAEGHQALRWLLNERGLGSAGQRVVVEELLEGVEVSVLAFSDGERLAVMPPARDYKRVGDGDRGPNTGGMGAYSPPSFATPPLLERARREILEPAISGMALEGRPFKGVIYAGIMVTRDGLKVLEFNCRFGDPETQVVLPRLQTELLDVLEAVVDGSLAPDRLVWSDEATCGVVLASVGYPGPYPVGHPVSGLEQLPGDALVFQAGTDRQAGRTVTAGGRVLTVVGRGASVAAARRRAYDFAARIHFDGGFHRNDVAADDETVTASVKRWALDSERA